MGFANLCVSEELETTRNGDKKHVGISDVYFLVYNNIKAFYWKENFGDIDTNVIKVYSIVFVISHVKLT